MSKRFTDTMKWRDAWFRKLSPETKLFWIYILDNCDIAGFWNVDTELAEFCMGAKIELLTFLEAINQGKERIDTKQTDRWQVMDFVKFQYGELSEDSPVHKGVLKVLKERVSKGYPKGIHTLKDKDKNKNKDKDKDRGVVRGEKEDPEGYQRVVTHVCETYHKVKGAKYPFGAIDGRFVKEALAKSYGYVEQVMALWDLFIYQKWDWQKDGKTIKVPHDLKNFCSKFNILMEDMRWKSIAKKYEKPAPSILDALPKLQGMPKEKTLNEKKLENLKAMSVAIENGKIENSLVEKNA